MLELATIATLWRAPERKIAKTGKPYCRLSLVHGKGDANAWISAYVFGADLAEIASRFEKGQRCYVEGSFNLDRWSTSTGEQRVALSVTVSRLELVGEIGRRRKRRSQSARTNRDAPSLENHGRPFNDSLSDIGPGAS